MTIPEIQRHINSQIRQKKIRDKEKATYDYILADTIGRSIARIYSSSAKMPEISAVYPSLFDSQEIIERKKQQKAEIFAVKLKQFAASHNQRIKEVAKDSGKEISNNPISGDRET